MGKAMQWQGINEFIAVIETGSFTGAASSLGVSTAHISRQIKALEKRLATPLIHRTTRQMTVTALGRQYYQQCKRLVEGLESAEQSLLDLQTAPKGNLKITAPVTFGERYVMPVVNDFILAHPALDVDVVLTNQALDIIDHGFDLAVRVGHLNDARIRARKLAERRVITCASPKYLAAFGMPHTVAELKHHTCLVGSVGHWHFAEAGKNTLVKVNGNLRCNSGPALVDAALKGLGIVQLPSDYLMAHLNSGQLIAILDGIKPAPEGVWGLYPDTRLASPKVTLMLDALSAHFQALANMPSGDSGTKVNTLRG